MPESLALVRALRSDGLPAVVSGAGPTVLVLVSDLTPPEAVLARCPDGWTSWHLDVDERDALVAATREVGFAVGHASAQLGWRGLRSRPTWKILVYSAEEPPLKRGLVLVDGVVVRVRPTI